MKKLIFSLIPVLLVLFLVPVDGFAAMHDGKGRHMGRYGGYCKGPKWGWYGAGRHVRTEKEVRELVADFLTDTNLTAGEVREEKTYFEVDIEDETSEIVDLLIVDKRTCRIRSAY